MHPRTRIPLVVGIIAAAAALAAAPALGGGAKHFKSTVTLAQANPFHGHVTSHKSACEVSRTSRSNKPSTGSDELYDSTTTGADGDWSIPATPNGKFYAKVRRRRASGTSSSAGSDISPTRHFGT